MTKVSASVLVCAATACWTFPAAADPLVSLAHDGATLLDVSGAVPQALHILRASYGPAGDPEHTLDATAVVRELTATGAREVHVPEITRRLGDPKYRTVKNLDITFTLGGVTQTATAVDGGTVSLRSAAGDLDTAAFRSGAAAPGLLLRAPGRYELRAASGAARVQTVALPAPLELDGAWTVRFPGREASFPALTSWHLSDNPDIKYFSGTAAYLKTFRLPAGFPAAGQRVELDLGAVHEFAVVILNGRNLGVLWTLEKRLDVTDALRPGADNALEIRVTNLWPNRLIGDQFIPAPDEIRNANGTINRWPQWLLDGRKDPSGRQTFSMWELWRTTDALLPSGLLGPVRLNAVATADTGTATVAAHVAALADSFAKPAPEFRPWVYWFWNNGNLNKEGVTADLEAMAAVGIGGVLIMDVGQGAPRGPVQFMDEKWREIFRFVISESQRLGIKVNMNNDAGWNGSGGAWITPEESMHILTWSETALTAPAAGKIVLPQPKAQLNYYRDIAVLAFPTPENTGTGTRAFPDQNRQRPTNETAKNPVVARKDIVVLTGRLAADGTLDWQPPAPGNWTLLRIGHTTKNKRVHPAPEGADGLECDKLSVAASVAAFEGQIGKLAAENKNGVGKVFVSTHIDSWENGSQTWTPLMREEFQKRRSYDVLSYLPVFAGYQIDSTGDTEDFLWDFRRTVSEMVLDYHVGTFQRLSHERGLQLSIEAYDQAPCDFLQFGGMADEPIGEFWTSGASASPKDGIRLSDCRGMASAGHIYGRNVIGAEAFTARREERFLRHPGSLKVLGDRAFAEGINRFIFHRYSFQPWLDVKPGLMMGPWGQHYERTQTWWHLTPAWHAYLARCQFMLRQGRFAADIAYIEPEDSPQKYTEHPKDGYAWDQCGTDAVLQMSVDSAGRLTLPGGARYEVLVLPATVQMTPVLLKKALDLATLGATVIGGPQRPARSPGLLFAKNADAFQALGDALWGADAAPAGARTVGKGRFIWGATPEAVLAEKGIKPDFVANRKLSQIHRTGTDGEIYFVANPEDVPLTAQATFRATGQPEIWHPETGRRIAAPVYRNAPDGTTTVALPFAPTESYFVVFPTK
ncbi:MAG: hypothetical protein LBW77_04875 [Verrucomicrobiota bacterium]|jgi:hypothetical protein|nr:hypothetical protein [Verrucomicrobiota bacterium]